MSCFFSYVTRIAGFAHEPFSVQELPQSEWRCGDYVVGETLASQGSDRLVELTNGRMVSVYESDLVVGSFGRRAATLEVVGDWRAIEADLRFDALTSGGVFGRATSKSTFLKPLLQLRYRGHVFVDGVSRNMKDYVPDPPKATFDIPVILIIGTSMDTGKTLTACVIVRLLKSLGLRVGGAKLAGVARYRDILAMRDGGADVILDFVDAGLASSYCDRAEYGHALDYLLARFAAEKVDVAVIEVGASPLEPYNGELAVERLRHFVRFLVLCASDPYAVVGVEQAFQAKADIIAGRATCTSAAVHLLKRLSPVPALNLQHHSNWPQLKKMLCERLELD
jgi:hypothetical protein